MMQTRHALIFSDGSVSVSDDDLGIHGQTCAEAWDDHLALSALPRPEADAGAVELPVVAREFFKLRLSQRQAIAATFSLSWRDDNPALTDLARGEMWLRRAKEKDLLDAVMGAIRAALAAAQEGQS